MTIPVRAVLFDYGLVLTGPPATAAWNSMKERLEADEQTFHKAYWRWRHAYDSGDLNGDHYWNKVAGDLGRNLTSAQRKALKQSDIELWTEPNEPMIAWAAELQRARIPTGILSNLGDAMEDGVRARCEWMAAFQHHTFSHRLGIAKPDLKIYHHAAQGLGVPPAAILFVDDREENITAARQAGMQAVQYRNHESFLAAMRAQGLQNLLSSPPKAASALPLARLQRVTTN